MRLPQHTTETAPQRAAEALAEYETRRGDAGPMVRMMASSPALLRGYLELSRSMLRSKINRKVTERISLAVQAQIGCSYCLVAHTRAARAVGVSETEIQAAKDARSENPAIEALLRFAVRVLREPTAVDYVQLAELRSHGYGDREIADVVGLVALNQLTGSFNLVAGLHADEQLAEASPGLKAA